MIDTTKPSQPPMRRMHRRSQNNVGSVTAKTTVIRAVRASNDDGNPGFSTTNQHQYADEFEDFVGVNQLILPTPYNTTNLFNVIERSNMLQQCVEAYVVNTVMTGWEVVPIARNIKVDKDEADELQSFIDFANSEESLTTVTSAAIRDRESVGYGFIEVIRDASRRISLLRWAPAFRTRLSIRHKEFVEVKYDVPRGKRLVTVTEFRKFRRFIQVVAGKYTWFKEFGDPRRLDSFSGAFEGEPNYKPGNDATEILHLKNPSNESYGIPRWINQLPSILGSREAEEVNMRYFEDNTVPPMMLTVGGGRLTAASYKELTRMVQETDIGRERQNKIMIVEAVSEGDSLDGKGAPVQLKVERLVDSRQSDQLFSDYDLANQAKVRSSFRLPAVAVGMANEHNFATANVAMFAAETQVYAPLRFEIDEALNNKIITGRTGLGMKTCKLASRPPAITSPDATMKAMTSLNVMGAVTPRSAQGVANKMLQTELPPYPQKGDKDYEDWMDRPMPLTVSVGNPDDDMDPADAPGQAAQIGPDGKPLPPDPDAPPAPGVTPPRKSKTGKKDALQNLKDGSTKQAEASGGTIGKAPKHGTE